MKISFVALCSNRNVNSVASTTKHWLVTLYLHSPHSYSHTMVPLKAAEVVWSGSPVNVREMCFYNICDSEIQFLRRRSVRPQSVPLVYWESLFSKSQILFSWDKTVAFRFWISSSNLSSSWGWRGEEWRERGRRKEETEKDSDREGEIKGKGKKKRKNRSRTASN